MPIRNIRTRGYTEVCIIIKYEVSCAIVVFVVLIYRKLPNFIILGVCSEHEPRLLYCYIKH